MNTGATIAADWLAQYRESGIYFPLPVLNGQEVAGFRADVEDFERRFEERSGRVARGADLGQCHLHFAWARRLALHPAILDIAQAVLGENILVHATTIFHKRPYSGAYVTWHQDGFYMRLERPDFLSVWVALTDSTPENGCLRVVAGSHKNGSFPHEGNSVSERNLLTSGLEIAVPVDESTATDVVLRAGEVSLHHVNIVHGSNPNHSAFSRIGFAIRYVAHDARQEAPHHAVVAARGRNLPCAYRLHTEPVCADYGTALDAHLRFAEELVRQRAAIGRRA